MNIYNNFALKCAIRFNIELCKYLQKIFFSPTNSTSQFWLIQDLILNIPIPILYIYYIGDEAKFNFTLIYLIYIYILLSPHILYMYMNKPKNLTTYLDYPLHRVDIYNIVCRLYSPILLDVVFQQALRYNIIWP